MGVSIDVYRCRIGTFLPGSVSVKRNNTIPAVSSKSSSYILILLIMLASCSFFLAYSLHISSSISYNIKPKSYAPASTSTQQCVTLPSPRCSH